LLNIAETHLALLDITAVELRDMISDKPVTHLVWRLICDRPLLRHASSTTETVSCSYEA